MAFTLSRDRSNDIQCGEAEVVYCEGHRAWMLPGKQKTTDRAYAVKICRRMDTIMRGMREALRGK